MEVGLGKLGAGDFRMSQVQRQVRQAGQGTQGEERGRKWAAAM